MCECCTACRDLCHPLTQMEVDYTVGQVFRALKSAGVYNNTFVFLTSDNG